MLPLPKEYLQSPCELLSMDNIPILSGYLSSISDGEVQISDRLGELPLVHCNTRVKLNVVHRTLSFRSLVGIVFLSTNNMIRVVEVQNAANGERRDFFRVKLSLQLAALPLRGGDAGEGAAKSPSAQPFVIAVKNLSLSGLLFDSGRKFKIGDRLTVFLDLYGERLELPCEVVRKLPPPDSSCCGCEFLEPSETQLNLLCKYLFEVQREQIRLMRNRGV